MSRGARRRRAKEGFIEWRGSDTCEASPLQDEKIEENIIAEGEEKYFDRWFSHIMFESKIPGWLDNGSCALRDILRDIKPILWLSWQKADPLGLRGDKPYDMKLATTDWNDIPGWEEFVKNAFPGVEP